jgi:hypothetical protein
MSGLRDKLHRPPRLEGGVMRMRYPSDQLDVRGEAAGHVLDGGFTDQPLPFEDLHLRVGTEHKISSPSNALDNDDICQTRPSFRAVYERLVRYMAEVLGCDFLFESTPNLRFHFPARLPDRYRGHDGRLLAYHSDTFFADPFEQINCWVPLSRCGGTNSMGFASLADGIDILDEFCRDFDYEEQVYVTEGRTRFFEKLRDDLDYQRRVIEKCPPLEADIGELILFDQRCVHGTLENTSSVTRVSLDFRILLLDDAEAIERHYRSLGRTLPIEGVENVPIGRGGFYDARSALGF